MGRYTSGTQRPPLGTRTDMKKLLCLILTIAPLLCFGDSFYATRTDIVGLTNFTQSVSNALTGIVGKVATNYTDKTSNSLTGVIGLVSTNYTQFTSNALTGVIGLVATNYTDKASNALTGVIGNVATNYSQSVSNSLKTDFNNLTNGTYTAWQLNAGKLWITNVGSFTNGSIIMGLTNNLNAPGTHQPPASAQYIFIGVATNLPGSGNQPQGSLFVSSNGVWFRLTGTAVP